MMRRAWSAPGEPELFRAHPRWAQEARRALARQLMKSRAARRRSCRQAASIVPGRDGASHEVRRKPGEEARIVVAGNASDTGPVGSCLVPELEPITTNSAAQRKRQKPPHMQGVLRMELANRRPPGCDLAALDCRVVARSRLCAGILLDCGAAASRLQSRGCGRLSAIWALDDTSARVGVAAGVGHFDRVAQRRCVERRELGD